MGCEYSRRVGRGAWLPEGGGEWMWRCGTDECIDSPTGGVDSDSILARKEQTISYWQSKMHPENRKLDAGSDLTAPEVTILPPPGFETELLSNDDFVDIGSITVVDDPSLPLVLDTSAPFRKQYVYGQEDPPASMSQPQLEPEIKPEIKPELKPELKPVVKPRLPPVVTYFDSAHPQCDEEEEEATWVISPFRSFFKDQMKKKNDSCLIF